METIPDHLLICCEGETEKEYLTALAERLEVLPRLSILKTAACSPIALLEEAYKDYMWSNATDKQFPLTEAWCVFDRDHHPSYDTTFEIAKTLGIPVHLCWTNPCIEFWFWLHYCGDKNHLKFDEFKEIGHSKERVLVSTDVFEDRTVRRLRRMIKPETMLSLLKEKCAAYTKAKCPPGIINRTLAACDNLKVVGQSDDPHALGSAMPTLLLRLSNLAEAMHGKKSAQNMTPEVLVVKEVALDAVPETETAPVLEVEKPVTEEPPATTEDVTLLSQEESNSADTLKAKVNRWIAHAVPSDPVVPLKQSLSVCLADWPEIHVVKDDLIAPEKALEHMSDLFVAVARSATDSKTREKGQNGLCCIKNLMQYMANVPTSQNRGKKIAGRLNAAGALLNVLALDWGMANEVKGMTFKKCRENYADAKSSMESVVSDVGENPKTPPSVLETKATSDPRLAVVSMTDKEEILDKGSETLLEEELKTHLKVLRDLQERFLAAMDCISVEENGKPSEIMPGVCDQAGSLEEHVLDLIAVCTEIANKASLKN